MSCYSLEELSRYSGRDLEKKQEAAIKAHLLTCSSCSDKLEHIESSWAALAVLEDLDVNVSFNSSVRRRIVSAQENNSSLRLYSIAAVTAAAVIVLVFSLYMVIHNKQSTRDSNDVATLTDAQSKDLSDTSPGSLAHSDLHKETNTAAHSASNKHVDAESGSVEAMRDALDEIVFLEDMELMAEFDANSDYRLLQELLQIEDQLKNLSFFSQNQWR